METTGQTRRVVDEFFLWCPPSCLVKDIMDHDCHQGHPGTHSQLKVVWNILDCDCSRPESDFQSGSGVLPQGRFFAVVEKGGVVHGCSRAR